MGDEYKVGDLVSWRKLRYDQLDDARGGDGTIASITRDRVTIEAVSFPSGQLRRFTFRLDEISLKKRG